MPKAQATPDDDDDLALEPSQADDIEDALLTEFQASGDDVQFIIRVCKISDAGRAGDPEEYLFQIDSAELPGLWDRLRDEQGTGIYRAHVFKHSGGRKVKYRQFDMRIRAANKKPEPKLPDGASLIDAIQRNNEMMFTRFETVLKERQPVAPAIDPVTMFEKAVASITGLMKIQQPQSPAQSQTPSPDTMLNLVTQGIEIGKSLAGGGNVDDVSFMGVVKEIFRQPAVGEAIGNAATAFLNRGAPGATPNAPPPQIQHTAQDMARIQLTNALSYLATKASMNKPVQLYVDWFIDEIPPDTVNQLLGMPDLLDQLSTNHVGVRTNRAWFEKFLDDLRGMMQPAPSPDASASASNGTDTGSIDGAA